MKSSLLFLILPVLAAAAPQNVAGTRAQQAKIAAAGGAPQAKAPTANNNAAAASNNNNNKQAAQNLSADQKQQISDAIDAWSRDTGIVSNFLDNSASFAKDPATFVNQANVANSAEIDELTHKQVLDQFLTNNANLDSANKTLVNGAFQLVVDQLQLGVDKGAANAGSITDAINNDRCIDVLPNIDTYLAQAGQLIGAAQTKSAIRPSACAAVSAAASAGTKNLGFQGNPPPQAAIDAIRNASSNNGTAQNTGAAKAAVGNAGTRAQQSAVAANNAAAPATTPKATGAASQAAGAKAAGGASASKATAVSKATGVTKAAGASATRAAAGNAGAKAAAGKANN